MATGKLAKPYLEKYIVEIKKKYPGIDAEVVAVENHFFGNKITVSGLVTGQDLISQLLEKNIGQELLIPCNMLRSGENVFLDDITVVDVEEKLNVKVRVVDQPGKEFVEAVLGDNPGKRAYRRQIYEQTDSSYCGQT